MGEAKRKREAAKKQAAVVDTPIECSGLVEPEPTLYTLDKLYDTTPHIDFVVNDVHSTIEIVLFGLITLTAGISLIAGCAYAYLMYH